MKQIARKSGIAYLMIFIAGFYANFAVLEDLINSNNPSNITTNLINSHTQFGYGLLGFIVMLFFDLVLVGSLFYLTNSASKKLSLIASLFRLLHAILFGVAISKLILIYQLTDNNDNTIFIQQKVMNLLSGFDTIWTIGLLFFGIHLCILGYLVMKSDFIPGLIGLFLILSAIGYFSDGIAKLTLTNYETYKNIFEIIVVSFGIIGELSFTVWLLIKGFKKLKGKTVFKHQVT